MRGARGDWRLTVRDGPRVKREHHATLDGALVSLEAAVAALQPGATREEARFFARRIEPSEQVAVRLELSGPRGERGGVDLRGDGTAEAFTGRLRRQLLERRGSESAASALERALRAT